MLCLYMGGANKNEIKIKKIYFVIEVLGQTEGAVLHLQHLYSPCKSQCFIGAQYQHAFGRRNFVFWTKFGTKKKGDQ